VLFAELDIDRLVPLPHQCRSSVEGPEFDEFVESIKHSGVLVSILVRGTCDLKFEVVHGWRRVQAARKAGLKKVPANIRILSDQAAYEINLTENIQRRDLSDLEKAHMLDFLIKQFNYTQEELGKKLGKTQGWVSQHLSMLQIPESITRVIKHGELTEGQAREILATPEDKRDKIIDTINKTGDVPSAREIHEITHPEGVSAQLTEQKKTATQLAICEGCKTNRSNVSSWHERLNLCPDCMKEANVNPEKFEHIAGQAKIVGKKKVSDEELSNLIICGGCGRSVGIMNAKNFDGKDLCPNCYDKAIHSKTERQERMHLGISKFEDLIALGLEQRKLPLGLQNEFIVLPFRFGDRVWYLPEGVLALRLNGEEAHRKRGDKDEKIVEALETLGIRVLTYTYKSMTEESKTEVLDLIEAKLGELGWKVKP